MLRFVFQAVVLFKQKTAYEMVAEALDLISKESGCVVEAEMLRVKAELLSRRTSPAAPGAGRVDLTIRTEAEACFREAIWVARRQAAKSLECARARAWRDSGAARRAGVGARDAGRDLRPVHGRLRHRGPAGREGSARGAAANHRGAHRPTRATATR